MFVQTVFSLATCKSVQKTLMTTFDGKSYSMMGKCGYVLSKHCHVPSGEKSKYEIRLINEKCTSTNPHATCDRRLEVAITGERLITLHPLANNKYPIVTVTGGGNEMTVEKYLPDSGLSVIYVAGGKVLLTSSKAGITILWDGIDVNLRVNSNLFEQTCGLCGTFDGDTSNDFHTHDDDTELLASSFAMQWKVNDDKLSPLGCDNGEWENFEKPCDFNLANKQYAETRCAEFKTTESRSSFAVCRNYIQSEVFYEKCLDDTCLTPQQEISIRVKQAYLKDCGGMGVPVQWTGGKCKTYLINHRVEHNGHG